MRITREKHMAYLTRLMPLLALALVAQCILYMQWAPIEIAVDVSIFEGIGIILFAIGFALYDHFHIVSLHRNHLSIKFPLLSIEEDILYSQIQSIDVEATKHAYYNVTLTLRDGAQYKLYYLDDVQELKCLVKATA
jgi:hypothetical protein